VEAPVITTTLPELPDFVDPVFIATAPDTPDDAAFDDASTTAPVPLLVLPPDTIDTDPPTWPDAAARPPSINTPPPVDTSDSPADTTTAPPAPLEPVPTNTLIAPPEPPVAKPDSSAKYPEFPEPVLPLLSVTDPDTPDDAAFDDASTTAPVPLLVLPPDTIDTDPPT